MRWMDDVKGVTGIAVNYIKELVQDRKKTVFISVKSSHKRGKGPMFNQG